MNCVISASNVKILAKAINTIAKIGDEIYFEVQKTYLVLSVVNSSSTEHGWFKTLLPFFMEYTVHDAFTDDETPEDTTIGVKLKAKPLCKAFKSGALSNTNLESCTISLGSNPSKLKINFLYRNKITRLVNIWLIEGDEVLEVNSVETPESNKLVACSTVLSHALTNFRRSDMEITFIATPDKMIVQNYLDADDVKLNAVRTQLLLSSSEFSIYEILYNTTVTFSNRAFRAAVHLAANLNRQVTIIFKKTGSPLEIQITNNTTFQARFIIATMNEISDTQSALSDDESMELQLPNDPPVQPPTENNEILPEQNNVHDPDVTMVEVPDQNTPPALDTVKVVAKQESNDELYDSYRAGRSPEKSQAKRMKFVFQRCLESTHIGLVTSDEEILAENSDPECEALLAD